MRGIIVTSKDGVASTEEALHRGVEQKFGNLDIDLLQ